MAADLLTSAANLDPMLSWRPRPSNRRTETPSEQQLAALRLALAKREEAAARERRKYRQLIGAVGCLTFVFGLLVGVYHLQIGESVIGIWESKADAGYAAFRKGKYKLALALLRPMAEAGDAHAAATLGVIYYRGGRDVQRDDAKAVKWLRLAAEQDDARAEFNLGLMYAEGQGVPQDNAEAGKWYRLAAAQGDAAAEYNLGLWYARGLGGSPDYVHAYMWFNLAASQFPEPDGRDRALAVNNRNAVATKMTSGQVAEAQWLSLEWKPK